MLSQSKFKVILGNEAIAFGALASGVAVACGYPGTPSSEIIETIMKAGKGVYTEWSANEKVAYETAYGAAMMGARALASMKHVGVNVASDAIVSSSYTGIEGALVLVSADDPSMWSSQNEQDNRYYGLLANIPVIEPYDPQSAYTLIKKAFELSDRVKHPVMFRTSTRISHVRAPIELEGQREPIMGKLVKSPSRYVLAPENARRNREEQLRRWEKIKEEVEELNELIGEGEKLVIASGIAYAYVKEILEDGNLQDKVKVLRISTPVPIPRKLLIRSIEDIEEALVVEELEPIVENQVKSILFDEGINLKVYGKKFVPNRGELTPEVVMGAVYRFLGLQYEEVKYEKAEVTPRPPAMCSGCPHRSSFFLLRKGINMATLKTFFSGDIGCYTLGVLPPFNEQDSAVEMGGSLGIANGVFRSTNTIPVAIIGDSTLFHSGLPGLTNAVYNKLPVIIIVLDNRVTAMTGQQESIVREIEIENVARGMGVKYVRVFDPFDINRGSKEVEEAAKWVIKNKEPVVLVAKRACALEAIEKVQGELPRVYVDEDKCTGCGICYDAFTCPAIIPLSNKKAWIDDSQCISCGACIPTCPFKAIKIEGKFPDGWDKAWLE